MSYSEYIANDMDYESDIDASVSLYELANGSAGCSLPDLRYALALVAGAVVIVAALAIAAVRQLKQ